jgi:transglutaminase-like putative cysteine protease
MFRNLPHALILTLLFFSLSSHAKLEPIKDLDSRYEYYRSSYLVQPDYTQEQTTSWALKILNKRAIEDLKTTSVGYSNSIEKIEIVEAYNRKADGKRIDTPKNNYQVRTNGGRNKDAPVFSDRSTISVVFPEVEVGDTLVFSYKRKVTEPMFPGYFAVSEEYYSTVAYDDVTVSISVPASFPVKHQTRAMKENIARVEDRVIYGWHWTNDKPVRDSRQDYSVWNPETTTGFALTTFADYQAIAEAYGKRALPKVKITNAVKNLANEIVGGEKNPKEQARLIYEWVATHITYAGNCVGVGAVVPHDIEFILDNKMGDCKDHATLLQALLTAKKIDSIQALINSGPIYQLPTIPAVDSVNHVINYLPQFDLFVDSTSDETPFGMLPRSVQGKPVLLVEKFRAGMKTPVPLPEQDSQKLIAKLDIQEDGSLIGDVSVELHGEPAVMARSGWRNVSQDDEDQWLKDMFSRNGQAGSATMTKDDPKPLADHYKYSIRFNAKEFLLPDSAGAFAIYSPVYSHLSIASMVYVPDQIEETEVACGGGVSREKYIYTFPKNFKLLDVPVDKKFEADALRYSVDYRLKNNVLTVTREFKNSTLGPTCTPDVIESQKEIMQKISRSLRSQIVYKPIIDEDM